jgi:peroxiredoxin
MKYLYSFLLILLFSAAAFSQGAGYKVGQPVQNFTLTGPDGKSVSLADYAASKAVVVVFVNHFCPNGRIYGKRLRDLAAAFTSKGVSFVYISPTISMEDGGPQVKALAEEVSLTGEQLYLLADPRHEVTNQFGATKIPEVYVLQGTGGNFLLKYRGAIDDNPQLETGVRDYYLRNALEAVLASRPVPTPEKRPFGCMIKRL